jgi:hypothetical protein
MREECPYQSSFADLQNLDYIWFPYREGWLITIEEKMWGKGVSRAQGDTHGIVAQLLSLGSDSCKEVNTIRGRRPIEYRGHYIVSFEKTNPDDSEWIRINGIMTDKKGLLQLLKTGKLEPTQ